MMESVTAAARSARPAALEAATLCEAFQLTAAERADQVALRTPGDGVSITFGEYAARVERIAAGLDALGVGRGDTVGLMLTNRPEFNLLDSGALHLGATPFSIYNTSAPEQIDYLFSNAENRVAVTERAFLPQVLAARERSQRLEHVVLVDGEEEGTIPLAELEGMGGSQFDFEASWRAVEPGDLLTLIYTSGTTGPPKGVQLTHANMMAGINGGTKRLPIVPGGRIPSYLPAAHAADRLLSHCWASICMGFTVTCIADPRTVVEHLPECRPTVWFAVPRIWEKIKAALEAQGITDPEKLPEEQRAAVRAKLGLEKCELLVSGAAPIPAEVLLYFAGLGLPICEVWAMSETAAVGTANPPEGIKAGTCGPALEGVELRIADDGEVMVRGPMVMKGYRNDPEKTAETIDADGWLHTGDIGELDSDGYLSIVDRKKELIINAAGKNMSPANIESRLKASSPLIGQCIAIGDRRPYNTALIVLDPDVAAAFAEERGLPDSSPAALAGNETVQTLVAAAVEDANSHLSRVEQVKRFTILPTDWLPDSEELTPTMKLKRKPIAEKYAAEIEALYGE
ncbi:MAG: AMP-dependent synthetase/ligase [Solirubrobacterales bacterium]